MSIKAKRRRTPYGKCFLHHGRLLYHRRFQFLAHFPYVWCTIFAFLPRVGATSFLASDLSLLPYTLKDFLPPFSKEHALVQEIVFCLPEFNEYKC